MREKICPPQLATGSGSLTSSGTLYFFLAARNDVGYCLPSDVSSITYSSGDSIEVTLPGDCERDGENILQYALSVNTINDPVSASILVSLNREDITLPHTFYLEEDSHIEIEEDVSVLPTGDDLIPGLVKQYLPTGLIYRYVPSSTLTPNGTTVISSIVGNWEKFYDGFSSYVNNTTEDTNGANLNVLDIIDSEAIITKSYSLDGSAGPPRIYWVKNDTTETVPQGTRVGLTISVNDEPASEDFESLIKVVFEGHVDPATGYLDVVLVDGVTPMEDVGVVKDYQFGRTDLILQKPLLAGEAFQIRVYPQFNSYELQSIPLAGTNISVLGFFFDEAGSYNDASALIGNIILPENPGLRRIYPSIGLSVVADEGSGTVGGFFFKDIGSNVVPALLDSVADQQIAINNNGSVYLNDGILASNEDLRALVSTLPGESITSDFMPIGVTGDISPDLTITVTYPNLIDPLYDDVIAGTVDKGIFNAEEITLYVSNGSEVRKFVGLSPTNTVSDTFSVSWGDGAVDTVKASSFGLWAPITPTAISTSTTGTVTYTAAVGFVYFGNSVTGISHKESDGVIPELELSIGEIASEIGVLRDTVDDFESFTLHWREPIESYALLTAKSVSDLVEGRTHRVKNASGDFEIWTWVADSLVNSSEDNSLIPDEYANESTEGRWIGISTGGSSGPLNLDSVVTYKGQVLVDDSGYVVTSELGGPSDGSTMLDDYLEDNTVGGLKATLSSSYTLTDQSNEYLSLATDGNNYTVFLYDGGPKFFRKHTILHTGATNNILVSYGGSTLSTLVSGDIVSLLWDTEDWIIL